MDTTTSEISRVGKRVVDYLWDAPPKNDENPAIPIWCLGRQYYTRQRPPLSEAKSDPNSISTTFDIIDKNELSEAISPIAQDPSASASASAKSSELIDEAGWPCAFLDDFGSRVWLTYRSGFPPIARASTGSNLSFAVRLRNTFGNQEGFTSDTGWGCMIRSGQMLLANTLLLLSLGRDWRREMASIKERQLLTLFADDPRAPYSIHRFVEHGASACGKQPGEWFGPSAAAQCIQALAEGHCHENLRVYSTGHTPDIYEDTFMSVARPEGSTFAPVLVLVGVRLGIDRVTPVYWDSLRALLELPQSTGIAGGRPRASHYFVAAQGQQFFYLDPHHTRSAIQFHEGDAGVTDEELETVHTRRLRTIHIRDMDPSMLLGFLIRDESDWKQWRDAVKQMPGKSIIHIADKEPMSPMEGSGRKEAIDEVEILDDDEEDDGELI